MVSTLAFGRWLFIGGNRKVWMLEQNSLSFLNRAAVSDWALSMAMLNEETVIVGQSYGFLEVF